MLSVMQCRLRPGNNPWSANKKKKGKKKKGGQFLTEVTLAGVAESAQASQSSGLFNARHFTVSVEAFENNPTEGQPNMKNCRISLVHLDLANCAIYYHPRH